ncbi:hypothetical protein K2173_012469 [Erythroxylum novogranatense]|uniref:LOB domain-containing protein n=1 Tax=Erythroxylum novogranatense TaxID=1862640 RepID=A0AAV8U7S5_9ROSI|nr:hypothetical protein K2173_012469 [Erythroxylum novogranatense]
MISGRCAACKYLRRRCASDCIFSPYFPANNPQRFACVHKIYGASNQLPEDLRAKAAESMYYEAQCRIKDPVYGCVAIISLLHQQIHILESQLAKSRAELAVLMMPQPGESEMGHETSFNNFLLEQVGSVAHSGQYSIQDSSGFM